MGTHVYRFLWPIFALTILVAHSAGVSADDFAIVPGGRVGDVSLDMPIEEILKLLGTPSRVDAATGRYEWRGRYITVYQSLTTGRITSIRTFWVFRRSNPYKTDKGIPVGATIEQVRQAYGDAGCFHSEGSTWRTYGWRELGIFFTIWTYPDMPSEMTNRIAEIGVQRPTRTPPGPGNRPCW